MKEIKLSQRRCKNKSLNLVALVDDADFDYLNQFKWHVRENKNTYYAARHTHLNGKRGYIYMHRDILGLTDSKIECDHRNREGWHNYRSNLRIATRSQNAANTSSHKNSSSKYRGVFLEKNISKYKGKHMDKTYTYNYWVARITKDSKDILLGRFKIEEDAAIKYNEKALELFGEFANLNNVEIKNH